MTEGDKRRSEGRMRRLENSARIRWMEAQRWPLDRRSLLLARRWMTAMVSGVGKGAGCCCMSAGRGGGIGIGGGVGMGVAGVGDCTGEEDGKCGVGLQRFNR